MSISIAITPAERYRVKRESTGERQVNLWMGSELAVKLDELVKTGIYRNRSEAVSAALSRLIENEQRT